MAAFDYSARDYETIRADLLARASRVFPEWTDRDPSDFGMLLVDLWASMGDVMHYYIDRAAGEAFLETATQRESVLALANLMDYVPRSRSSATGTVTLANSTATGITVPAFTEFVVSGSSTGAYTLADAFVPATSSTAVSVREGTLYKDEVLTSSANGVGGQVYTLIHGSVDVDSIAVTVYEDGITPTQYQRIARLIDADTGDRIFVASVAADGFTTISFGTSVNGFFPPVGAKITATYSSSVGSAGNLPASSVIGFKGTVTTGITISASSAFTGGVDEESIVSLRSSIPSVISAQNRAVTREDFIALANQVEDIAKATIAFTPSVSGASAGNASVTVYAQPAVSDYLTSAATSYAVPAATQAAVVGYIQPLALLGVTVLAAPTITWEKIKASITVVVADRFVSNWVKNDVSEAIDKLFAFDNVFFGQRITLGQIYRAVLDVPGVEYCTVSVFDLEANSGLQTSITVNPLRLPKKGTITLTMSGGITTS